MNFNSNDVSDDFTSSGKIYLNNASVSLMPAQSIDAMKEFLIDYNSLGPDSEESKPFITEKLRNVRTSISKILNCQPDEIVLTQSTTDGINLVANGLSLSDNSNIVIRGMAHEHHANFYPWLKLGDRISIKSLPIDKDGLFTVEQLANLVDNDTKLVALSHALYNTGAILPVKEIGKILKDTPYFIDSAQTIGCIGKMDIPQIRCNFMSFNGSKWLCGPMGTGLFYCNRKSSKLLEPPTIGGESAMLCGETDLAYKEPPDKFQTGFRNYVGIVGLESSVQYLMKFGLNNIRQKNQYLSSLLREELSKISKIVLYGPDDPNLRTSIVSFNVQDEKPQDVVAKLERKNIVLAVREINEQKIVRASPHFFNTESEMIQVVEAIKDL